VVSFFFICVFKQHQVHPLETAIDRIQVGMCAMHEVDLRGRANMESLARFVLGMPKMSGLMLQDGVWTVKQTS